MSLIVVSGAGGSGVTTVAQGIAHGLRGDGYSTAEVNSAVAVPLGISQLWTDAVATFGVWLQSLGSSTLASEELEGLIGLNELVTGAMVADAVNNTNIDVVVWDMGSIREALRTLQLLDTVPVLLDRLLTGPVAAQLSAPDPDALIVAWYGLVTHVAAARDAVHAASSVLVGNPNHVDELMKSSGSMRLYGCTPSAVVLNKAPSVKSGADKNARKALKQSVARADAMGVPVVILPTANDGAPQSKKVAKWLGPLREVLVAQQDPGSVLWNVRETKKGYALSIALRQGADVQVGRRGDSLLVVCDGHRRQLELPAVLKRCMISRGGMVKDSLVLHFVPDPKLWRERS